MVEVFLVLSNLLFGISILVYFFIREIKNENREFEKFQKLNESMSLEVEVLQQGYQESLKTIVETTKSKDNLTQKALLEYLKHNERLEKMILPQPVTRKAVQDILDQTPPMVPNEIEKLDVELQQDELNEMLSKIPITKDTKLAFEGDEIDLPEEMDGAVISGKIN